MEMEEAEDEEWDATTITCTSTSQYQYSSKPNANSEGKVKYVFKKILVAGFVASSAPLVLPPLFVASAIGLALSMPYALFYASHTCTQNLMNKLLPRPKNPPTLQDFCFQPDIDNDIAHKSNEEWSLNDEAKTDNEIVHVNEENMIHDSEKLCEEEDDNVKLEDKIYGESDVEKPMSEGKVVDEFVIENEESETSAFEFGGVTDVVLEEYCCDEVKEGDIEEQELQRETKGLLEKFRDECRNDMRGEYEEGICKGTNESDQDIGLVVENVEDGQSLGNEENSQVFDCEEMHQSRNDDNDNNDIEDMDSSFNEVEESCEHVRGNLEVDSSNDLQKPMTEETCKLLDDRGFQYDSVPAEGIRDFLIETQVLDISVAEEDSSEVINDNTDTHENFLKDQESALLQKGKLLKLDDKMSDFQNQEMQMLEESNIMGSSSGADGRKIADESTIPLCSENPDAYSYTIDLHNESTNVTVDPHTDSMEVLVSSVEEEELHEDEVKEGDIEEKELQRETKGLLEKIRDECRTDMRGEYVEGICRGTNESDQDIGLVVENVEDGQSLVTEGDMKKEENSQVFDCEEEMLQSRNADNDNKDIDSSFNEVESCEPVRNNLEVDSSNDLQKPMAEETCELLYDSIPAEGIRDLLIETQVFDISVAEEDSSEVTNDQTDAHENFQEEQESTILQKGKLDDKISDFGNQEMQMHEESNVMDSSSDADARKIADESGIPLCDENPDAYSYTIDLHNESSNVTVDAHTDSMEVLVSSVELDSKSSECSSGKNIVSPSSEEVVFNEGDIWKEIHAIRKIIGYESTSKASCVDELKALYIFTGVEPPTFVKENPFDPAEINEKLHFLMSIVGIKSNVP